MYHPNSWGKNATCSGRRLNIGQAAFFLWGGKTHCTLIATPNVDNANRRQKKGKKLNYKLCVILMQKGILVFVFANYSDAVLVWK
jgi:hypothetical protein